MKTLFIITLIAIYSPVIAQTTFITGRWETGFWEKLYKQNHERDGEFYKLHKKDTTIYGKFKDGKPDSVWIFKWQNNISAISDFNGVAKFWICGHMYCQFEIGQYKNGMPTGNWKTYQYEHSLKNSINFDNYDNDPNLTLIRENRFNESISVFHDQDTTHQVDLKINEYIKEQIYPSWLNLFDGGIGKNYLGDDSFISSMRQSYAINLKVQNLYKIGTSMSLNNEHFISYGYYSTSRFVSGDEFTELFINDTLTLKHDNLLFKFNYGKNLTKELNKFSNIRFNFSPAIGVGTGRLKLVETILSNQKEFSYSAKNPYIIFDFMLDMRAVIVANCFIFSTGFVFGNTFDISNKKWRKDQIGNLPFFSNNNKYGMMVFGIFFCM